MDYGSGPYIITFTAGTIHASLNVSLIDDDIFEGNKNFLLTINSSSLPNNVTVGDPGQVTLIIEDNDGREFHLLLLIIICACMPQNIEILYLMNIQNYCYLL